MTKRNITETDRLVAKNIKRIREICGIDRRTLEEKAGIAYGILDQIETFHKPAGKIIQKRIADTLNCSLAELYKEDQPKIIRKPMVPNLTKQQKQLLDTAKFLTNKEFEEALSYLKWLKERKKKVK